MPINKGQGAVKETFEFVTVFVSGQTATTASYQSSMHIT
jgi:hypothetical protein